MTYPLHLLIFLFLLAGSAAQGQTRPNSTRSAQLDLSGLYYAEAECRTQITANGLLGAALFANAQSVCN